MKSLQNFKSGELNQSQQKAIKGGTSSPGEAKLIVQAGMVSESDTL